jgi:hypothetical protein
MWVEAVVDGDGEVFHGSGAPTNTIVRPNELISATPPAVGQPLATRRSSHTCAGEGARTG